MHPCTWESVRRVTGQRGTGATQAAMGGVDLAKSAFWTRAAVLADGRPSSCRESSTVRIGVLMRRHVITCNDSISCSFPRLGYCFSLQIVRGLMRAASAVGE